MTQYLGRTALSHRIFTGLQRRRLVLMAEEHTRLIKELELRKANVVSGFRMDIASQWGGGIRCASHPLLRDA